MLTSAIQVKNLLYQFQKLLQIKKVSILISGLALLSGFVLRVVFSIQLFRFDFDQARDAFLYQEMWKGKEVYLGSASSIGGYSLPPLYYYFSLPFTIFGSGIYYTALFNITFSFLSVVSIFFLIWLILENLNFEKKLLISSLTSLWWSFFFIDIVHSQFAWNPNSTPFFLSTYLILGFLITKEIKKVSILKFNSKTDSLKIIKKVLYLSIFGILIALLTSLHSSNLFILLPFTALLFLFWLIKGKGLVNKLLIWIAPLFSFLSLTPYWIGETKNNWQNSLNIYNLITNSESTLGFNEKFTLVRNGLVWLFDTVLFLGRWNNNLSLVNYFLLILIFLGFVCFAFWKLRIKAYWVFSISLIFVLYLYSIANYNGFIHMHYQVIMWFLPMLLIMITLAGFLEISNKFIFLKIVFSSFFSILLLISFGLNLQHNFQYNQLKYADQRIPTIQDTKNILALIPNGSKACVQEDRIYPYSYILQEVLKKDVILLKLKNCAEADYQIYQKYLLPKDMFQEVQHYSYRKKIEVEENLQQPILSKIKEEHQAFILFEKI